MCYMCRKDVTSETRSEQIDIIANCKSHPELKVQLELLLELSV